MNICFSDFCKAETVFDTAHDFLILKNFCYTQQKIIGLQWKD